MNGINGATKTKYVSGLVTGQSLLLVLLVGVCTFAAYGHPGGTDDLGCHNERQEGGYHCHSGPLEGREFASAWKAESALAAERRAGGPHATGYERDAYGGWTDTDRDCRDTRTEVLLDQARGPVEWETARECEIATGIWRGPYTGEIFRDPSELHIDHVVPLAEAHESGAATWPSDKKREFANDPANLLAVESGANMSKGAEGPADWMPPRHAFHCTYVKRWRKVKEKWDFKYDYIEATRIERVLERCAQ
ncbi:HNH endonuclease [Thiohalorhabdus methylotrophus]|uniref:HNH endonuclease n=1 Tax=Thiohalorhabdus methylotrophus TaxID=3242694 RepID=A0ABV4TQ69_9GAMM